MPRRRGGTAINNVCLLTTPKTATLSEMSPVRLSAELGISDKTLRAWLRREFPRHLGDKGSSWWMTPDQIAAARDRWGRARQPASIAPRSAEPKERTVSRERVSNGKPTIQAASSKGDAANLLGELVSSVIPIAATTAYSDQPGIYGVFFLGDEFPLPDANISKNTLVYIGKTESSQITRDLKQHLADSETGHSTLRRTFAALIRTQLELRPCSRSETEKTDKRFVNYRLDDEGERRLTAWMRKNLGLAFAACTCSVADIRRLEHEMIHTAVPPLNLLGNPTNPYLKKIKAARASCVAIARQSSGF